MTSLLAFLLISIKKITIEDVAVFTNQVQKLKELVSLCKFQLFAISNKENSSAQLKSAKLLAGKTLMSSYILGKFWGFSKRISPKLFGPSGSNFQR